MAQKSCLIYWTQLRTSKVVPRIGPRSPVHGESTVNKHVAVDRANDKIRGYYWGYYMSMLRSLNLGLLGFLDSGDSNALNYQRFCDALEGLVT